MRKEGFIDKGSRARVFNDGFRKSHFCYPLKLKSAEACFRIGTVAVKSIFRGVRHSWPFVFSLVSVLLSIFCLLSMRAICHVDLGFGLLLTLHVSLTLHPDS